MFLYLYNNPDDKLEGIFTLREIYNLPKMNSDNKDQNFPDLKKKIEELEKTIESYEEDKKRSWNFKIWVGNRAVDFFAGKSLKGSFKDLYNELPNNISKNTLANLSTHILWRFTRIGIFAMLVAMIPILILAWQGFLLNRQNTLLEKQNERIIQQVNLEEASRRSSLVFLFSNIMDQIDEEIKKPSNKSRKLSDQLIARIAGLTYSLKPYKYLENDSLSKVSLSPERGQLLINLVNSKIDTNSLHQVFGASNFEYSDLRDAKFSNANFYGAGMNHSNLTGAYFSGCSLEFASLENCTMENSSFLLCDLKMTWFDNSNLRIQK